MAHEEWRPIPDSPGYEASNLGRVRSVTRRVGARNALCVGKVLKATPKNHGYPVFMVHISPETKRWKLVHRAVLEAFVGPCPDGCEALHKNGVRTDNRIENLRWGTRAENVHDMHKHRTHPNIKLTDDQVDAIRADGRPHRVIAEQYGVDRSLVGKIKNGECRTKRYAA